MKKRILALLLAAFMLLSLSGCDSREKPEPEETPKQEEVQTPEVKPEEPEEKQEIEEEIVIEKPELGEEIAELKAKNGA